MITKEVNDWIKKVQCGSYSDEDVFFELSRFVSYLTKDELELIKRKIMIR